MLLRSDKLQLFHVGMAFQGEKASRKYLSNKASHCPQEADEPAADSDAPSHGGRPPWALEPVAGK